jgi:hypothetical protein
MFHLRGIDRWNRRRRMRCLRNRKRFETGARRQIKILFELDENARSGARREQTMNVIVFATAVQRTQHLFQFLFCLRCGQITSAAIDVIDKHI